MARKGHQVVKRGERPNPKGDAPPAPSRALVADPPWPIGRSAKWGNSADHYKLMTMDEIRGFELPPLEPAAWLFLWRLSSMVEEAYSVVRAWGFVPKSEIVWEKPQIGMGHYVRNKHETCIVAVRGRVEVTSHSIPSVFHAKRMEHSRKPEEFYRMVEALAPGPYTEIFARRRRQGWTSHGDEIHLIRDCWGPRGHEAYSRADGSSVCRSCGEEAPPGVRLSV